MPWISLPNAATLAGLAMIALTTALPVASAVAEETPPGRAAAPEQQPAPAGEAKDAPRRGDAAPGGTPQARPDAPRPRGCPYRERELELLV